MIKVSVEQRHVPVLCFWHSHHLQGVRGRATPPRGSARGTARSHARSANARLWEARRVPSGR
jgi:hypothetical protein